MSGAVNVGAVTLPKASAFTAAKYLRVKLDSGVIALAGIELEYGTLEDSAKEGDTVAAVLPIPCGTVRKFIAGAAIAKDAAVYPMAGGKVDDAATTGGDPLGWALAAASGDGAEVEVLMARQGAPGT